MTPRVSQEDEGAAVAIGRLIARGIETHLIVGRVALALATVRAEEREACYDAVEAVAMRFRANHDPMSENAADECCAAIRAREDT